MAQGNKNPKPRTGIESNKGMGNNIEREIKAALYAEPAARALMLDLEEKPSLGGPFTTGPNSALKPKDAQLKVRVPSELKDMLEAVCAKQGVEPASVVRALVHYYIKNYGMFISNL